MFSRREVACKSAIDRRRVGGAVKCRVSTLADAIGPCHMGNASRSFAESFQFSENRSN
jgi:hypothetical protein